MAFEAVDTLVRRAAGRFPRRIAVEGPRTTLTYAGLAALSDRVAADLTEAGARAGDFVPILAEDRAEVIAGVLGVLRIGGVFVPIDPGTPQRQISGILDDVNARHTVVGSGVPARLTGLTGGVVTVDAAEPAHAPPLPERRASPDDPCYVFYTSGSTGRPKGVLGRLCAIGHYVGWEIDTFGVTGEWRVSQLTSPAFDAMLRDFFVPLTVGGTVCVPPAGAVTNPGLLLDWLDGRQVNLLHCIPSVFRGLTEAACRADAGLAALRVVACAGEVLPPADAARWFGRYGERIGLVNLYGPSETTMTKLYHMVSPDDTERPSIPVGRPMPGAEVLILDDRGRSCPPGTVGEIHLRTPYRSLGYHDRPEETRAAFVPNPLGSDPADIVYKTGDLGRMLPDGELEYIGRLDHQVKIAGVRVEPTGVESVLRMHPSVREAAVALFDGPDGLPYLSAFIETSDALDERELRDHVHAHLPEALVPAVFVPVAELPRTISGKIDRRRLPDPAPTTAPGGTPPRTPTEQALARLWAGMLPPQEIDVRRRFFHSGGHSLQVMRMLERVREDFGVEVPLRDFLAAPTIESLAVMLEDALAGGAAPLDDALESLGITRADGVAADRGPA
ncbi:amino acid adenylation domain-containing protein [Spongiactinospora sp. 9N601]|uniref:amino acid adenylation domain-containing protein n=1 Tax=Spongiactinospora sp. 9N601 TaxID=3375149 RepID=UPI0037BA06FB